VEVPTYPWHLFFHHEVNGKVNDAGIQVDRIFGCSAQESSTLIRRPAVSKDLISTMPCCASHPPATTSGTCSAPCWGLSNLNLNAGGGLGIHQNVSRQGRVGLPIGLCQSSATGADLQAVLRLRLHHHLVHDASRSTALN